MIITVIFYRQLHCSFVIEHYANDTWNDFTTHAFISIYEFLHEKGIKLLVDVSIYYFLHFTHPNGTPIDTLLLLWIKLDFLVRDPFFGGTNFPALFRHISDQLLL